jgi:hypothetical protein
MKKNLLLLSLVTFLFSFSAFAQKPSSAQNVIARYVDVIGGKKRWASLKSTEFHAIATIGNKTFKILSMKVGGDRYFQSLEGEGLSIIQIYDSGKAVNIVNGQRKEVSKVMLDHFELHACFLPDVNYTRLHYTQKLVGLTDVDDVPCYKIELTSKNGSTHTNYYEKESGLLTFVEKDGTKNWLKGYKFYKGISIPYVQRQEMAGGTTMDMKVTDLLIDQKSTVALFNAKKKQVGL